MNVISHSGYCFCESICSYGTGVNWKDIWLKEKECCRKIVAVGTSQRNVGNGGERRENSGVAF